MTTFENRPNTALLVIDVQNGVVEGAYERDAVVANIADLVEQARREQVPVVWVRHADGHLAKGSEDWQIVPELTPDDLEPLIEKSYGDSFEDTDLETVLSGLAVGRLVIVGAQTDACIRSRCTARSFGATTPRWSATPTPPRTSRPGGASTRPGHHAHQPLLVVPDCAGTDSRHGRVQGRRLRRLTSPPTPQRTRWRAARPHK